MRKLLFIFLFAYSLTGTSQNYYFPPATGNWATETPQSLGWCQPKIDSLYAYLDAENTKSFIVLKDGKIVLEKYFNGHNASTLWVWFSAAKSLRAVLVGIAQSNGDLNINDKVSAHLGTGWSSLTTSQEDSITIWHQLTMTTGLDDSNFDCTDDTCLTYKAAAGARWAYQNATYNLLKNVLESATGINHNIYTLQKIKAPIGMQSGVWVKFGYNHFFASYARDMAKFGILMANKGNWSGTPVLNDTNYFNQMVNSSQTLNPSYGLLWWLNGKSSIIIPGDSVSLPFPLASHAPSDVYLAAGAQGQFISVSPSKGLIIIRQGTSQNGSLAGLNLHNEIWKRVQDLECHFTAIEENAFYFSVYPNPSNTWLNLKTNVDLKRAKLTVVDALGKTVLKENISQSKKLKVSSLPDGIYTLIIESNNHIAYKRFVIQR